MIGSKVFIFDQGSDLFIKAGEIIDIQGDKALVMIIERKRNRITCIVDSFDLDKLYLRKKVVLKKVERKLG